MFYASNAAPELEHFSGMRYIELGQKTISNVSDFELVILCWMYFFLRRLIFFVLGSVVSTPFRKRFIYGI